METFFSFLERRVDDCSSLLCVGLDPHVDDLSAPTGAAAQEFCLRLVRATSRYAAAFKPNAAFFEALGPDGWSALKAVIDGIRLESQRLGSHIPVILDAKRGDIASTAEAYARSAFEVLGADAITLNPYLGRDSIEPFVHDREHGAFLLCKTSNPAAGDIQDLQIGNPDLSSIPLHQRVAQLAASWNTQNNIGIVVAATYPETLAELRALVPDLWFLVPGVGAQAGDLDSAIAAGLRTDGKGVLINVSRAISRSSDPALAAAELRDSISAARGAAAAPRTAVSSALSSLADALLDAGCVQFGDFTLKSGLRSPIYIDLRRIISRPQLLRSVGAAYLDILRHLKFDRLAAIPYAAIPIAASIALQGGLPMIYPRRETKDYGTRAEIEGSYTAGETVVLIDDLATTGGSKFEAIEKLEAAGLLVTDVVVLIDRQSGARQSLAAAGRHLHAVFDLTSLLRIWEASGRIDGDRIRAVREFLKNG